TMNANFFNQIQQLEFTGNLQLTIAKGAENNLIVSVLLNNEQCGDQAKELIPPLTLRGTAEDLDNGFFGQITAPIQAVSGLMVDMEKFQKQLDEAKKQSAIEKAKTEKAKKEQDTKTKKYKDAMAKADTLEKESKFREAWMKVPDITEYPEKADEIRKRKSELSAKFAPDLFGTEEKPQRTEEKDEQFEQQVNELYADREETYSEDEQEQDSKSTNN